MITRKEANKNDEYSNLELYAHNGAELNRPVLEQHSQKWLYTLYFAFLAR